MNPSRDHCLNLSQPLPNEKISDQEIEEIQKLINEYREE